MSLLRPLYRLGRPSLRPLRPRAVSYLAAPSVTVASRPLTSAASPDKDLPRLVNMKQGPKMPSLFSEQEYESRLAKLRAYMRAENMEACVFTSYQNINYYSGFTFCYFGRQYALVVTHDKVVTMSAGVDGGQPYRRSYGDNLTYTDWQRDNFYHAVATTLSGGGVSGGKVGTEHDNISLVSMRKLQQALPHADLVDVHVAVMKMRMIKSPQEIKVIREGARIADLGGAAVVEATSEGVPEHEVALHSTRTMVREIAKTFPQTDIMDTWTWFQSGLNTDGAHNPVTTRRVQKGDILILNCFPMIHGYYTALERTLFLEHASDEHLRLWNINCDVHRRGLELMKPGVRCRDIAAELNEIYRSHDLMKNRSFGYGHSFGVLCHYYGRETELELREDIDTVLEAGMVVSMEPMIMIPEGQPGAGGYREHDILVLTEGGADNITTFPFGPEHNIIKK